MSGITKEGVEMFKSSILARCSRINGSGQAESALLPLLHLCQAAMASSNFVKIATDQREAVRDLFTSFVTPLRSSMTESSGLRSNPITSANDSQHFAPPTTSILVAEAAHACLSTMKLYQYNYNSSYEKDGPNFSEPNSIFSDDLVEILMDLDTIQCYEYRPYDRESADMKPLFRTYKIRAKRERLTLQKACGQELQDDISEFAVGGPSRVVNTVDGADVGRSGYRDTDSPTSADIQEPEGTVGVTANKEPGDDVDHSQPPNVNNSSDSDSHTNVDLAVSPYVPEDSTLTGDPAQDDKPGVTTRTDHQDNLVAQHDPMLRTSDTDVADVAEQDEIQSVQANIHERESSARVAPTTSPPTISTTSSPPT